METIHIFMSMKPLRDNFMTAARDYLYLLERAYPRKTILKLVATRHALSAAERSMLYRGVSPSAEAKKRKAKKTRPGDLERIESFHIDTLNVVITIHSYLAGKPVFISSDGFLRDAAESHGNDDLPHLGRTMEMLARFLEEKDIGNCSFYLDKKADILLPVLRSLRLSLEPAGFNTRILVSSTTDKHLEKASKGIVATSDSAIIDRTTLPVADLPGEILRFHFNPDFISLEDIS